MRYVAVPWQLWEIVNNVDREVIVDEVRWQPINATKHLKNELERCFSHTKGNMYLGHMLLLLLANRYIWGYISWAYCNILWDNKEVVSIYGHWDQGCWGIGDSTSWYPQSWALKVLLPNHHHIECSRCHVRVLDKFSSNALILILIKEFMKVVDIAPVQVSGSVEHSTLSHYEQVDEPPYNPPRLSGMHVCARPLHLQHIPLLIRDNKLESWEGSIWRGGVDKSQCTLLHLVFNCSSSGCMHRSRATSNKI